MSHETARRNYNRLSRWYDLFSASERRFTETGLSLLNVQPGERVLEIGFGTGHSLVTLAQSVGETGKVYGIDISDGMLELAQQRVRGAGLASRTELKLADATALDYPPESLDAILMSFTLELFDASDLPRVLGECTRTLRRGGRLGVVSMAKQDSPTVRLYEWAHRRWPEMLDCRPIDAQAEISSAGFEIGETLVRSTWGLPVDIIIARKA